MATQRSQTVHSGCTVLLKVKGKVVGRAQSLDGRRSYGTEGVYEQILTTDIIDIEVISKADNSTIRVYRGCTAVDYSENFRVGAISGENATFQYLSCDTGEKKDVAAADGGGGTL